MLKTILIHAAFYALPLAVLAWGALSTAYSLSIASPPMTLGSLCFLLLGLYFLAVAQDAAHSITHP